MNAVGACGLQLYRFGEVRARAGSSRALGCYCAVLHTLCCPAPHTQAISIVFFTPTWRPDSFYDRIRDNRRTGAHTLCLLDIKVHACACRSPARAWLVQVLLPCPCGHRWSCRRFT